MPNLESSSNASNKSLSNATSHTAACRQSTHLAIKNHHKKYHLIKIIFLLIFVLGILVLLISKESSEQELEKLIRVQSSFEQSGYDKHFSPSPLSLAEANIDKVYADKSTQKLYLLQDGKAVKSYHIALGDVVKGHKQQEGDERTPEGLYILDYKNENSIAHRSIHISYPNNTDRAQAKTRGVNPGGDIMIHGQMNGFGQFAELTQQRNWTDGCLAVTNAEMDEIMNAVKVGTPIEIVW
ncbi:L,D-transpeptidase family protein [Psychrobacter sp.]|uniref:L,D-transpeptidase family protein n=1 Tax=Psychrobacter sp. TaxID=56811 RepID=UPI0025F96FF8|nr:L,D-transpeptidase family protein [Psychrobacter sp.]